MDIKVANLNERNLTDWKRTFNNQRCIAVALIGVLPDGSATILTNKQFDTRDVFNVVTAVRDGMEKSDTKKIII